MPAQTNKTRHSPILLFIGIMLITLTGTALPGGKAVAQDKPRTTDSTSSKAPLSTRPDWRRAATTLGNSGVSGSEWADISKLKVGPIKNIYFGGYYRFFGFSRYLSDPFSTLKGYSRALGNGDGYREPTLDLIVSGRPTNNTTFATEIFLFHPYPGPDGSKNLTTSLNLGVNLYASYATKHGDFNLRAGGIHWYRLSPLTMGVNRGFNRFSSFDRNPWEPVLNAGVRNQNYYELGALRQDVRWLQQAFQGLILEGTKLGHDMEFSLLLGKTQNNGGGSPAYLSGAIPNFSYGGRLLKNFGTNWLAYNHFTSSTSIDSIKTDKVTTYSLNTLEYKTEVNKIAMTGEVGFGQFQSPITTLTGGVGGNVRFYAPPSVTYVPLDVQFYYLDKSFVNVNGSFINSSFKDANPTSIYYTQPFAAPLTNVGGMTNNRTGLNFNTEVGNNNYKLDVGLGFSRELESLSNQLSYGHNVNGLSWSRFGWPGSGIGPYKRINCLFRYVSETVNLNYAPGAAPKKNFSTLEVHGKMKHEVGGRDLIFFYLGSYNSIQDHFSAIPDVSENSWIRAYYHEFDVQYPLMRRVVAVGYYGIERIIGNYQTDLDENTGRPRNQTGNGYGLGLDFQLATATGLFIRQRWYDYKDANFSLDHFKGNETTVELKVYF